MRKDGFITTTIDFNKLASELTELNESQTKKWCHLINEITKGDNPSAIKEYQDKIDKITEENRDEWDKYVKKTNKLYQEEGLNIGINHGSTSVLELIEMQKKEGFINTLDDVDVVLGAIRQIFKKQELERQKGKSLFVLSEGELEKMLNQNNKEEE